MREFYGEKLIAKGSRNPALPLFFPFFFFLSHIGGARAHRSAWAHHSADLRCGVAEESELNWSVVLLVALIDMVLSLTFFVPPSCTVDMRKLFVGVLVALWDLGGHGVGSSS